MGGVDGLAYRQRRGIVGPYRDGANNSDGRRCADCCCEYSVGGGEVGEGQKEVVGRLEASGGRFGSGFEGRYRFRIEALETLLTMFADNSG